MRATPVLSWKGIAQEIGQKSSPKEWEKYGIPEGTSYKQAIVLRLYHAIMEEKAYYLIPKLWEYTQPSTKQVEVNVIDWRTRFEQAGVPMSLVAERLRIALTQTIEQEARETYLLDERTSTTVDTPANRIIDAPGSTEQHPAGRPDHAVSDAEPAGGQETGEVALGSDSETETPE